MLAEVRRFHGHAHRVLADERAGDVTLGAFVAIGGYSRYFVEHFLLPVVASVWSAGETVSLAYPASYLFAFLHHHGMLAVTRSPRWSCRPPCGRSPAPPRAWRAATTPTPPPAPTWPWSPRTPTRRSRCSR